MSSKSKIIGSWQKLKNVLSAQRRKGKIIAFTNGCFDILHLGHISYLEEAKKPNRILVIGINSDASVQKIKGKKRPIVSQNERAHVLASLGCVDYVTVFSEPTPLNLIKTLRPDVLIKGADWKNKEVAGADFVKRVEFIRYLTQYSTTKIIESIQKKCAK